LSAGAKRGQHLMMRSVNYFCLPPSASSRCSSTAETIAIGFPIAGTKQNHRRVAMPFSESSRIRYASGSAHPEIVEQPSVEPRRRKRARNLVESRHPWSA